MPKYSNIELKGSEGLSGGGDNEKRSKKSHQEMNSSSSKYATVGSAVLQGGGDDDDEEEHSSKHDNFPRNDTFGVVTCSLWSPLSSLVSFFDTVLFMWMKPLLRLGNEQPLNLTDLYELNERDQATHVYESFYHSWQLQLANSNPSLALAFIKSFGTPFFLAGGLKLIHDCLLFVGPFLLNRIITFLDNPDKPVTLGLIYVVFLFVSQVTMSLCLRQYFFWCFRCGMWLRSAVVTSVFAKALVISAGVLGRRTVGEITNLMSVDSTRLQTLTPYLHAIWYSFLQIGLALYFLWGQLGASCLGGIAIIILVIPVTKKVSKYLGSIQKALSKIRDRRVKLSSEVLGGMKIIKFQAWEKEFHERVKAVREEELDMQRKYIIANTVSMIIYTSVPLLVSSFTFMAYVASGHELDVATALTSLALFEILRFPLFMLPNVLNNIVEAKVSVDRVGSFLLEQEKKPVSAEPLWLDGIQFDTATLVHESVKNKMQKPQSELNDKLSPNKAVIEASSKPDSHGKLRGIWNRLVCSKSSQISKPEQVPLTELEFELIVRRAQVRMAENHIHFLENESRSLHRQNGDSIKGEQFVNESQGDRRLSIRGNLRKSSKARTGSPDIVENPIHNESIEDREVEEEEDNILTLYRVNMSAQKGHLLCIVGKVGSGKSSCLSALLGDMLCVLGKVSLRGSVSYVAQRPFIQNSTLKDNILFGRPYDEEKYNRILRVCALTADLKVNVL